MTTGRHSQVFQQLRQAVLAHDGAGLTDADLMCRFVAQRDGAALEALIRRHGSMVWSVCRRVLSNEQDAEDAFQASFLVFVRKAASIRGRAQVGNWLYGVAYRTAIKARSATALRRTKERQAAAMTPAQTQTDENWPELLPLLDQELARLPDKYRTALVLCELEGRARKEAARQLGIPEGTLSSRLATGRRMLAKRLGRPGLTLSAGAIAASAAVSPTLMASTVKAVSLVAAGQATVAGVVTVRVAALAEGVVKAMFLSKLSAGVGLLAVVALLAAGAGGATYYAAAAADPKPQPQTPPVAAVQAKERNGDKAENVKGEEPPPWGEAVDGVQARLRTTQTRWDLGAAPEFILDMRNQGEKTPHQCRAPNFCEVEWDGQWYRFAGAGELDCKHFYLNPGRQIDDWVKGSLAIRWIDKKGDKDAHWQVAPGKHTVRVAFMFDGGTRPVSQPVKIEVGKESAWGEAVDGVQARLRTPSVVWRAGVAPTFILDLRNHGIKTADARRSSFDAQIEVDGSWYSFDEPAGPHPLVGDLLEPGKEIDYWANALPDKGWGSFPGKKKHFPLPPGKHTVRIALWLQHQDGAPIIRPVSGPIEIEVEKEPAPGESVSVDGVKPPAKQAAPADVAGPNDKQSPARRAVDIQKKLSETINYELAVDTTLDKALDELLTSHGGIPWTVNDAAFGPDNKDVVKKTPVEKIDPIKGVTVATVLNRLLANIPNDTGKTTPMYLIRPDSVEITTRDSYQAESYPNRRFPDFPPDYLHLPPPVYAAFDKVPLSEALAELGRTTGGNVIVAGYAAKEAETKVTAELTGVPLDAAVTVLADMADLKCVRVGNIYYVTTSERARRLETEEQERRLKEEKQEDLPAKPQADKAEPKK